MSHPESRKGTVSIAIISLLQLCIGSRELAERFDELLLCVSGQADTGTYYIQKYYVALRN